MDTSIGPSEEVVKSLDHQFSGTCVSVCDKQITCSKQMIEAKNEEKSFFQKHSPRAITTMLADWVNELVERALLHDKSLATFIHMFQPGSNTPAAKGGPNECTSRRQK